MRPANIDAARRFVDLVTGDIAPTTEELSRSLDELAVSYHGTPFGSPGETENEPPASRVTHAELAARFPEYGYYAVVDPLDPLEGKAMVGDAIDDLMDITNELTKVLWRFEEVSADDAHWHFRFLFGVHWGLHLRNLAHYLHSKQFY